MRWLLSLSVLLVAGMVEAQTATPDIYVYATTTAGQVTRFDYVATAGDVQTANLVALILYSVWAMFLFAVFMYLRYRKAAAR